MNFSSNPQQNKEIPTKAEGNWIEHPLTLESDNYCLLPLEMEHFKDLLEISKDKRIWEFYIVDGSNSEKLLQSWNTATIERKEGNQYPFVIKTKKDNKIIGSTHFLNIQPEHKKLEIGWTWIHPNYWNTNANKECKKLLLTYCFETLKANRVQLQTDENNIRSRKAIEKIGGKFEGILRNDLIRDNDTIRSSAYYSIISTDWAILKKQIFH
ncbi:GNAT family protein [Flavobacterium sp. NG2]|uniref:GNAT family N-acetyltransferase n=1 Tax=Flavobacterium sp. NG2 TaxID=3097547 RepID=UPI002A81AF91|nr:GNAT family protein [Flavobacterium sp. NG2]WPR70308.1 GNAT family protein [Flavobacterium sp. NG2]